MRHPNHMPNRPTFERSTLPPTLAYGTTAFPHSCEAWSRLLITRSFFFQARCRSFLSAIRRITSIVSVPMRKGLEGNEWLEVPVATAELRYHPDPGPDCAQGCLRPNFLKLPHPTGRNALIVVTTLPLGMREGKHAPRLRSARVFPHKSTPCGLLHRKDCLQGIEIPTLISQPSS